MSIKKTSAKPLKARPNFSEAIPGILVAYREIDDSGVHYGYFRKYEKQFGRVIVQTIPPYKGEPRFLSLREDLVDVARLDPGMKYKKPDISLMVIIEETPAKRIAPKAPVVKNDPTIDRAPQSSLTLEERERLTTARIVKSKSASIPLPSSDWRKAAAKKAWETIRARRAATAAAIA